ncbi:DUF7573 domain-containing protein [Halapricum hydrolyticum]|uniref:DUF7573 domain-containing protein n=1 Tax=Halapricum hydrolyticum TaxID=2979991 RepID=A0AAE3I9H6_9EURY|nr:hypothetical protein [Halapricum hydrolyticum]MCU4718234.1 hypothetical protein [Halapricum hydrolyticum]MCU4726325.1 hypothetical protein [Halapricum hydrolyticum]
MERDATLEDFLDSGEGDPPDTASGGPIDADRDDETPDTADRDDETPDTADRDDETPDTAEPDDADIATSAMSYRSGGGACAVCGTVVERRWRDDDGLVCRDCKTW